MSKRRSPLDAIRFFCAVMIFLHHWPFYEPDPLLTIINTRIFTYFYSPVTFFFILSGWALTSAYYEKIKNKTFNLKAYVKKRILRLYPIHFIGFIFMVPLITSWVQTIPLKITIANLLLVHAFFSSPLYLFSYNGLSWCLSIFLFWYVLFPFVMIILARFDSFMRKFSFIPAFLLIFGLVLWISLNKFEDGTPYVLYFSPFERLIDCMVGVCIFFMMKQIGTHVKTTRILWTGIELGAIGIVIAAQWFAPLIPWKFLSDAYFILPWGAIVGIFALSRGHISSFLLWKPFQLLGSISLEFFLIHPIALRWVYFFMSQNIRLTPIQMGITSFIIALWGSVLAHYFLFLLFRPRVRRAAVPA